MALVNVVLVVEPPADKLITSAPFAAAKSTAAAHQE
jgi:hypothetical protein